MKSEVIPLKFAKYKFFQNNYEFKKTSIKTDGYSVKIAEKNAIDKLEKHRFTPGICIFGIGSGKWS